MPSIVGKPSATHSSWIPRRWSEWVLWWVQTMQLKSFSTTAESSCGLLIGQNWWASTNKSTDNNFCWTCFSRLSDCPRSVTAIDDPNWQSLKNGFFVAWLSFFNDNNKWGKATGSRDLETSTKPRKLYSCAIFCPKPTKSSKHPNKLSKASIRSNLSHLHLLSLYSADSQEGHTSSVRRERDSWDCFQVSSSTSSGVWSCTINLTWGITRESMLWTSVRLTSWNHWVRMISLSMLRKLHLFHSNNLFYNLIPDFRVVISPLPPESETHIVSCCIMISIPQGTLTGFTSQSEARKGIELSLLSWIMGRQVGLWTRFLEYVCGVKRVKSGKEKIVDFLAKQMPTPTRNAANFKNLILSTFSMTFKVKTKYF